MLVILKEPHSGTDFDTLAVNINSFESIIIRGSHKHCEFRRLQTL